MPRDRVIYQSENLFASKIDPNAGGNITSANIKEINRVQDMSYNLEVARTDINEFGQLAALSREVTEPPTVSLDFSYLLTTGIQEQNLGLDVNADTIFPVATADPLAKSLLDSTNIQNVHGANADELNFYVVTTKEGDDLHDTTGVNTANHGCIAIGNGFLTSYSISAAVGELASASVSVEASNMLFKNDLSGNMDNPAIDVSSTSGSKLSNKVNFSSVISNTGTTGNTESGSEIFAIRPGDITIDFDATGFFSNATSAGDLQVGGAVLPGSGFGTGSKTAVHIQNVSLEVPIGRTPMTRLGNHFPFARKIDFPVTMTLSASALMTDFDEGSLDGLICGAEEKRDIALIMKDRCGSNNLMTYVMRNAILDTEAFSASIGDNKTVDLTFSAQVGGANDSDNGIFLFTSQDNTPQFTETPTLTP
jgi:hypothetical protein